MKIKSIHFVGIKGVGMAPLAIIAKQAKIKVTGSDIAEEFITDSQLLKEGITIFPGFSEKHITNQDLVIVTGAHGGFGNLEVKEAQKRGIKVVSQGEAVGIFMDGEIFGRKNIGISIAGCHGKTTTTAMLATILKEANLDPSFVIGTGEIVSLGGPGHFGKGRFFVAEADEYATEPNLMKKENSWACVPKFLWQHPKIAVFTNIELDHTDLYKTEDEIIAAYEKFAAQVGEVLIVNGDNTGIKKIIKNYRKRFITFGTSSLNDFVVKKINVTGDQTFFWIESRGTSFGEFCLNVTGEHNALNAAGAIVAALECGLNIDQIKKGISKFSGTKRRFEFKGQLETGASVYDDYAHHPTEIKATLRAFKQSFPKSKIICIFQPHTFTRTKSLFEQFSRSFNDADEVLITKIYPSLREDPDPNVSSERLAGEISKFNQNIKFLSGLSDVVEYIKQKGYSKDCVIVTMGAGDVYKISEKLDLKIKD